MDNVVTHGQGGQPVVDPSQPDPIADFAGKRVAYYRQQFGLIGQKPGFKFTFNGATALAGSIWFGARGLWGWFLGFLVVEVFALVQIANGVLGNLGGDQHSRAESIARTLQQRRQQIEDALRENLPVDGLQRVAKSLEAALAQANQDAIAASGAGLRLVLIGLAILFAIRLIHAASHRP